MDDASPVRNDDSEVRRTIALRFMILHNEYKRWAQSYVARGEVGELASPEQVWLLYLVRTEALAPGQLARRLMVSPTVITGMVDRLEKRGLMRREPHPSDRRRTRLILTDAGHALSVEAEQRFLARLGTSLDGFDREQLDVLTQALGLFEAFASRLDEDAPESGSAS